MESFSIKEKSKEKQNRESHTSDFQANNQEETENPERQTPETKSENPKERSSLREGSSFGSNIVTCWQALEMIRCTAVVLFYILDYV